METTPKPCNSCCKKHKKVDVRLTDSEYLNLLRKAKATGLNRCEFIRKLINECTPQLHLTQQEADILDGWQIVHGDFVAIQNALKGLSKDERFVRMQSPGFMTGWLDATSKALGKVDEIIKQLSQ